MAVKCPKCKAPKYTNCRRVKPGRKVEVQYLKGFHTERKIAAQFVLTSRTVVIEGIELPWVERERYGPYTTPHGVLIDKPPKGTVLNQGAVFIPFDLLHEVAERTSNDYVAGYLSPDVDYRQGLALEEAGLAVLETRGGYHGTDKLRKYLEVVRGHRPNKMYSVGACNRCSR
jgi:hypothetical protein